MMESYESSTDQTDLLSESTQKCTEEAKENPEEAQNAIGQEAQTSLKDRIMVSLHRRIHIDERWE